MHIFLIIFIVESTQMSPFFSPSCPHHLVPALPQRNARFYKSVIRRVTSAQIYDLAFFKSCIVFNCTDFTVPYYCRFEGFASFLLLLDSFLRLYSSEEVIRLKGITVPF